MNCEDIEGDYDIRVCYGKQRKKEFWKTVHEFMYTPLKLEDGGYLDKKEPAWGSPVWDCYVIGPGDYDEYDDCVKIILKTAINDFKLDSRSMLFSDFAIIKTGDIIKSFLWVDED